MCMSETEFVPYQPFEMRAGSTVVFYWSCISTPGAMGVLVQLHIVSTRNARLQSMYAGSTT
jgi:hypothetical protein